MASLNKVQLIGNLGQDPEVRTFPDGGQITNCSIATSESWKDRASGEKKEKTEWHRVVFRGKLAEIAGQYLRKGSKVYIEGQLQTRKYQGQDGQDRYTTEVLVGMRGSMIMLDGRPQGQSSAAQPPQGQSSVQHQPQAQGYQRQAPSRAVQAPPADFDEDIPF